MTAKERIEWREEGLKQTLVQALVLQDQLAVAYKRIEELEKQKMPHQGLYD
jgi:hypothetical protein